MGINPHSTVVVAMSGGVDSSAAAALLVRQGHHVIGVTMRLWTPELGCAPEDAEERYGGCCAVSGVEDARRVCQRLGIAHYVLNLTDEFLREVVEPFVSEYQRGRTPNPCIWCNERIKFDLLLKKASALGAHYLATGHHARIERLKDGRARLLCGRDRRKDQAYFLYRFAQQQLRRVLMPVGDITKAEAREITRDLVPRLGGKSESQDICFVPDGDYRAFIAQRAGHGTGGEIVHTDGRVLGRHDGLAHFTLGQRRGLGVSIGHALYVVGLEPETARVIVGDESDLMRRGVRVASLTWVSGSPPEGTGPFRVKLRYNTRGSMARVVPEGPDTMLLTFRSPQRAPARGQAAVVFNGDEVLGGGIIEGAEA